MDNLKNIQVLTEKVRDTDFSKLDLCDGDVKILSDILNYFEIDVDTDERNKFFWNLQSPVVVEELRQFLDFFEFKQLWTNHYHSIFELTENTTIKTGTMEDILKKMKDEKAQECLEIFLLFKLIRKKFNDLYKMEYASSDGNQENKTIKMDTIYDTLQYTENTLRNTIAPNIVPPPINDQKIRMLGLFEKVDTNNCWYIMRRQKESWLQGENNLKSRGFKVVCVWDNVTNAITIYHYIKESLKENFVTNTDGCLITLSNDNIDKNSTKMIINIINKIIYSFTEPAIILADGIHSAIKEE